MIIAYLRVSTCKQDLTNQRYEIEKFAQYNSLIIGQWIEETISGTKDPSKRKLGEILKHIQEGDIIVASSLSRLGRNMYAVSGVLNQLIEKKVQLWTVQENFKLSNDITAKVLSTCLLLVADLERSFISERTKAGLAAKKAAGVTLGRPKGALSHKVKLSGIEEVIKCLLECGNSYASIARSLNVDRSTLTRFCDSRGIKRYLNCNENEGD